MEIDSSNGRPADTESLRHLLRQQASVLERLSGLAMLGLTREQIQLGLGRAASSTGEAGKLEDLSASEIVRLETLGAFVLNSLRSGGDGPTVFSLLTDERRVPGIDGLTSYLEQIGKDSTSVLVAIYTEFHPRQAPG
jgi:hypothetical protein